jgi:hypothetical protein
MDLRIMEVKMTKEELIMKIKKLGDMSLNDQIGSYDVYC